MSIQLIAALCLIFIVAPLMPALGQSNYDELVLIARELVENYELCAKHSSLSLLDVDWGYTGGSLDIIIEPFIDNATNEQMHLAISIGAIALDRYLKNNSQLNKIDVIVHDARGDEIGKGIIYSRWLKNLKHDAEGNITKDSLNALNEKINYTIEIPSY
jgi:hypothetical protein